MLAQLARPGYRALKLKDEADLAAAGSAPDATLMLDTFDPTLPGGTGRPFNWEWARALADGPAADPSAGQQPAQQQPARRAVILAGGLSADNIAQAIRTARPAAVDVSSSLEASPGRKDPAKVQAFFSALRIALATDDSWSGTHAIAI